MNNTIKLGLMTLASLVSTVSMANEIASEFLKNEIELAHTQYLKGTTDSGLYALQALVRILESDSTSSKLGPNNLSFTYLRIGLLHEQAGNDSKAKVNFKKAQSSYSGNKIEIAQLKEMVAKLDKMSS